MKEITVKKETSYNSFKQLNTEVYKTSVLYPSLLNRSQIWI